jgi:tRNA(Ile)-lysidine synthase
MKTQKLLPIPTGPVTVACSGGADSVAAACFMKFEVKANITLAYVNHGTGYCLDALRTVEALAAKLESPLVILEIDTYVPPKTSRQEHWRNQRYKLLNGLNTPVILGHQLDDAVESWIFSSLNGTTSLIPYAHGNCVRPFLTVPKTVLREYAESFAVPIFDCPSNSDLSFRRNYIRHELMPHALVVNPGLHAMVRAKILRREFKT